ncbi:phage tail tape measure protein [Raineya sp.]
MKAYEVVLKIQDMVSSPVARISSALGGVSNAFQNTSNAAKAADNQLSMFGKAFQFNQIVQAVGIVKGAFESMMAPSMSFDAQMSEVGAVSGAVGEDFAKMRQKAIELGNSTSFSATQAAQGLTELSRAGFTASDSVNTIGNVLSFAAATNMELGRSSEIVANTMATFSIKAEDSARVTDVFAKAVSRTNTTVESMAESMKYLGPTAASMGISLEEASAAVGILGDYGMKGSMATRALGTALGRFAAPTTAMQATMAQLGFSAFDANGKFIGLATMIEKLSVATKDYTQEQKMAAISTLFGAEATGEILTLMSAQKKIMVDGKEVVMRGAEALRGLTNEFNEAAGTAEKMSKRMLDNLKGDVTILQSGIEGLFIRMGDSSNGFMREVVQGITSFINAVTENFQFVEQIAASLQQAFSPIIQAIINGFGSVGTVGDSTKNIMQGLAGIVQNVVAPAINLFATILSPLVEGLAVLARWVLDNSNWLSVLAGIYGTVIALQWAWNTALTANPIGLIIGAIATLIGLLKMAYDNSELVRTIFDAVGNAGKMAFEAIGDALKWVWDKVMEFIEDLKTIYNTVMDILWLGDKTESKIASVQNSVEGSSLKFVSDKVQSMSDGVKSMFETLTGKDTMLGQAIDFTKKLFKKDTVSQAATAPLINPASNTASLTQSQAAKKGIDSVSAGGNKQLHVTVNISKLQAAERMEVNGAETNKNGLDDLESKIITTITRAINGAIQLQTSF